MTKISNKNITDLISSIENLTSAMSRGKDDEELKKEREFNKELDKIMSKDLRGRREERKKAEEGMKKATSREEFEKYKKKYEATKTSFENEAKSMKATAVKDLASGLKTVLTTVFNPEAKFVVLFLSFNKLFKIRAFLYSAKTSLKTLLMS